MITTKAGYQIKIVEGSRKSITGKKHFVCEYVLKPEDILKGIASGQNMLSLGKRFKLTKSEMKFDSEQELWDALGLNKV